MPFRVPIETQDTVNVVGKLIGRTERRLVYMKVTGASHTVTFPQGLECAHIYAIHLDILPSAVVANRYPRVQINKTGTGTAGHPQAFTLIGTTAATASLSTFYSWAIGNEHLTRSDAAVGTIETIALPQDIYIDQGDGMTVYMSNGDGGDVLWIKVYYEVDR